jgi:membrane fusion protein, multidrug efflux system
LSGVFGISEALNLRTVNAVENAGLDRIELILADGAVYPSKGRFANLTGAMDEKTGSFLALTKFANPKAFLLPGMTGRVRFSAGISAAAVGAKAVYVVNPDRRIALRTVTIEGSYQGKSAVTKGSAGASQSWFAGSTLRPGDVLPPEPAGTPRKK